MKFWIVGRIIKVPSKLCQFTLFFISMQSYNIFSPNPNSHRVERGVEWGIGNWRLALSETVNNDQRTCEKPCPYGGWVLQCSIHPVGVGFIPTLAAAGYLLCILSAVGRTGINPVPTADACNTLAINVLSKWLQHSASVGVGFIPTLAAAWYLHQFLLVAGRTGINPVPTAAERCKCLIISSLSRILGRVGATIYQSYQQCTIILGEAFTKSEAERLAWPNNISCLKKHNCGGFSTFCCTFAFRIVLLNN